MNHTEITRKTGKCLIESNIFVIVTDFDRRKALQQETFIDLPQIWENVSIGVCSDDLENLFVSWPACNALSIKVQSWLEPPHDKTNNVVVCPAKTQINLCLHEESLGP